MLQAHTSTKCMHKKLLNELAFIHNNAYNTIPLMELMKTAYYAISINEKKIE